MSLLGWKPANAFFIVLRYERTRSSAPLRSHGLASAADELQMDARFWKQKG